MRYIYIFKCLDLAKGTAIDVILDICREVEGRFN